MEGAGTCPSVHGNLKDRHGHLGECEETGARTSGPFNFGTARGGRIVRVRLAVTVSLLVRLKTRGIAVLTVEIVSGIKNVAEKTVGRF